MADKDLRISITLDANTSGAEKADGAIKKVSDSTDKLGATMSKTTGILKEVGGLLGAIGVALGVREIVRYADTWNLLEGRLKLVTTSAQNLVAVQNELFNIAQSTRQSYEATADMYTRMARASEQLGKSQKDVMEITQMVNEAMIVSGASTQEAEASVIQLAQALGSGKLQGDELRSIMENAPRLARAIADGMGVAVGQLKELGSEGKLTSEIVFNALQSQKDAIDKEFSQMPVTIGQAITTIENSFMRLIATADDAVNGSGGLTETLSYFSKAIDNNKAEIIEFGRDFYRALQLFGSGIVALFSGAMATIDYTAGGILKIIQTITNGVIGMINGSIHALEFFTNKARSVFGGNKVSLGRIDEISLGDSLMGSSSQRWEDMKNAFRTMGDLTSEIAGNTTVIKKNFDGVSDKAGNKKTYATPLSDADIKKAEQARKKEHDDAQKKLNDISKFTQYRMDAEDKLEAEIQKRQELEFTADEEAYKALVKWNEEKRQATMDYYEAIGDKSTVFYMEESDKLQQLAETGALTNEQMIEVWEKDQKKFSESLTKGAISMQSVFEDAFKSMEDSLVTMFKNGKFEADKFFQSILEGLLRMQIRNSVTQPLTNAFGSVDWGSIGTSVMNYFASANGNAFSRGVPVHAFANGGAFTNQVVSKPTIAPMALFGEAGDEAIMPLTRIGGSLGVKATPSNVIVNIENNSGTPISEDNVSTSFDTGGMIVNIVLDAIARNKNGARDVIRGVR